MRITEDKTLIVTEEDISGLFCYLHRDGTPYEDGFDFEIRLQEITIEPGSIERVTIEFTDEDEADRQDISRSVYRVIAGRDPQFVPPGEAD